MSAYLVPEFLAAANTLVVLSLGGHVDTEDVRRGLGDICASRLTGPGIVVVHDFDADTVRTVSAWQAKYPRVRAYAHGVPTGRSGFLIRDSFVCSLQIVAMGSLESESLGSIVARGMVAKGLTTPAPGFEEARAAMEPWAYRTTPLQTRAAVISALKTQGVRDPEEALGVLVSAGIFLMSPNKTHVIVDTQWWIGVLKRCVCSPAPILVHGSGGFKSQDLAALHAFEHAVTVPPNGLHGRPPMSVIPVLVREEDSSLVVFSALASDVIPTELVEPFMFPGVVGSSRVGMCYDIVGSHPAFWPHLTAKLISEGLVTWPDQCTGVHIVLEDDAGVRAVVVLVPKFDLVKVVCEGRNPERLMVRVHRLVREVLAWVCLSLKGIHVLCPTGRHYSVMDVMDARARGGVSLCTHCGSDDAFIPVGFLFQENLSVVSCE